MFIIWQKQFNSLNVTYKFVLADISLANGGEQNLIISSKVCSYFFLLLFDTYMEYIVLLDENGQ